MTIHVVRVEEKSKAHLVHHLSDGRYVLEDRHSGAASRWSIWKPKVGSHGGKHLHTASTLGKLLKWAERHP